MLKKATVREAKEAAHLALLLWPNHMLEEFSRGQKIL